MIARDSEMLTQAIERNCAAVLALPSAGMNRIYKTRFLRGEGRRIWLDSVPGEQVLIQSLVADQTPVGVCFKIGQRKISFSSPILELDEKCKFFDAVAPIQALLMERPETVKPVQRRMHFRMPLRDSDQFSVRLWRVNEYVDLKDEPKDIFELPAEVCDLSVGGLGVIFRKRPLLVAEQRLRVLLKHGNAQPMLIEGRSGVVRFNEAENIYETGIEFRGLQASLGGRKLTTELTRLIAALELTEARRKRGGGSTD
jgi:c-di-GMP-binding flagellar brake protein YcgR